MRSGGGSDPPESSESPLPETVLEHNLVVWFGDLNYRLNLAGDMARTLAERGDYEVLHAHDQLGQAQRDEKAFNDGFEEAPLTFAPTYKYDVGTDSFDSSEKRRPPAWCDRVLWREGDKGARVSCSEYVRHDERTSDHRPVSAR